jgi:hypothetical protein
VVDSDASLALITAHSRRTQAMTGSAGPRVCCSCAPCERRHFEKERKGNMDVNKGESRYRLGGALMAARGRHFLQTDIPEPFIFAQLAD